MSKEKVYGLIDKPREDLSRTTDRHLIILMPGSSDTGKKDEEGKKIYKQDPSKPLKIRVYEFGKYQDLDIEDLLAIEDLIAENSIAYENSVNLYLDALDEKHKRSTKLVARIKKRRTE